MKPLKIGVIGVGHAGSLHLNKLSQMKDVLVSCVVDIDKEKAKEAAKKVNVPYYTSLEHSMDKFDAAIVSVPARAHYKVAKSLILEGKHLLIEKPFTTSIEQAEELQDLIEKKGVIVGVGHSERFNPVTEFLKKEINNPGFIEGERISPFTNRCIDVDVVLDMMIHDIDLILYLMGTGLDIIDSVGVPVLTEKIDIANARIRLNSSCIINLTASRVSDKRVRKLRFFQPDSYISVDFTVPKVVIKRKVQVNGGVQIISKEHKAEENDPIYDELRNFINAVKKGKDPAVPPNDALKSLKLAIDILKKMIVPSLAS